MDRVLLDALDRGGPLVALGENDAPDPQIMEFARESGYVVFTNDLDFGVMLAVGKAPKPSVIQLRTDCDNTPEVIGSHILGVVDRLADELREGALVTVDLKRARLRILPFA